MGRPNVGAESLEVTSGLRLGRDHHERSRLRSDCRVVKESNESHTLDIGCGGSFRYGDDKSIAMLMRLSRENGEPAAKMCAGSLPWCSFG